MKLRSYLIAATLIFMVVAFWGANAAAYDMTEYFPLNQGDEWIYLDSNPHNGPFPLKSVINGTEMVNGVETIKFEGGNEGGNCYTVDSEGLKLYKWYAAPGFYLIYGLPKIIFPAQFDVGESYQGSLSAASFSTEDDTFLNTFTGNHTVTLKSVEDLSVRAGTFKDCLKISTSETLQRSGDLMITEIETTGWYARNIGLIKSIFSQHIQYPEEEGFGITMTVELISATVDGAQYGDGCPAISVLGEDSNDLKSLRRFRDEVLTKTPVGQKLIKLYYEWSPAIVEAMEENETFKKQVKKVIKGILSVIKELAVI